MPATRVTVSELRDLHRQARRLDALAGGAVASLFPGAWRARLRGRGMEFEEVRPYLWGDDFRTIDWRVTARTGEMHTRLYHEERERTLWLVCDAGPSMQFGTRNCFKWVRAAQAAVLFAWLAHDAEDRVGAVVHGDGRRCHLLPAGGGEAGLMRLFHLLAAVGARPGEPRSTLADAAAHLRRLARPGSLVLFVGDFRTLDREAERHLARLAGHGELAAIHLHDPLERTPPPAGLYPLENGEGCSGWLDTTSPALRRRWEENFEARRKAVADRFARLGARTLLLGTHEPLVDGLREQLR